MKATAAKLLEFLKKSPHLIIPIYQRAYSWTERECMQLWEDIMRTGKNKTISAHFVGSIVYIEEGLYNVSSQSPLLVIDGQQRLTTVTLILEALARHIGKTEPVDGFSAIKIRHYYLQNPLETGNRKYKLLLSQTDDDTLKALIDNHTNPKNISIRIAENFKLFQKLIADTEKDINSLCDGLAKLIIVDISLSRDQDNPQLIFESLNSTGKELSQADLIRNYILMGLDHELQKKLYELYWRPMEVEFGQESYANQFDSFMRHYLIVKTGVIPNISKVYEEFKLFSRSKEIAKKGIEALVQDISRFSIYYCNMALNKETDKKLKVIFHDIRELKVDVAYPLLLVLYNDYAQNILSKSDFLTSVRLIEAYVFRRSICSIPTNSLNKTFATFSKVI
ncbi:MAG: DUF262 domain-containing protein, partial [Candidatus Pacearchaeota archaeon]|nr:DUF262 domain-containing protein [Candidatus Pacearchaeota archaeon]